MASLQAHAPTLASACRSTAYNKQLQRTVLPGSRLAACASFHYAHAARPKRQRAAAELRR
jgi:hypothetical protein